jgi:hypothetical protein
VVEIESVGPVCIVVEHAGEALFVIPAVVECLEDHLDVLAREAVEVRDDGVEFVDFVLFFVFVKWSMVNTD